MYNATLHICGLHCAHDLSQFFHHHDLTSPPPFPNPVPPLTLAPTKVLSEDDFFLGTPFPSRIFFSFIFLDCRQYMHMIKKRKGKKKKNPRKPLPPLSPPPWPPQVIMGVILMYPPRVPSCTSAKTNFNSCVTRVCAVGVLLLVLIY